MRLSHLFDNVSILLETKKESVIEQIPFSSLQDNSLNN